MPSLKSSNESVTLLRNNAAGNFRVKPIPTHYFDNPRALKNCNKCILPIFCQ